MTAISSSKKTTCWIFSNKKSTDFWCANLKPLFYLYFFPIALRSKPKEKQIPNAPGQTSLTFSLWKNVKMHL